MTQPVGLQGLLRKIVVVSGRTAAYTSSRSSRQPPPGSSRLRTKSKPPPVIRNERSTFGQAGQTMIPCPSAPSDIRAAMKMPSMVEPGTTMRPGARSIP